MKSLKEFIAKLFGYHPCEYNRTDPVVLRFSEIEDRVNKMWHPRDLYDLL